MDGRTGLYGFWFIGARTRLTLAQVRDGLAKGDLSSVELTEAFLAAIDAGNSHLNAYITVTGEAALVRAKDSDARIGKGD